jgi:phosphate transport system substrate-binding protein
MLSLGVALVGLTSLALTQTSPALADPSETLVAVGADTTQDVVNQFAADASGNLLGSYNATNPVTGAAHEGITPADGTAGVACSFARPNGTNEGLADLRLALNPATTNGGGAVAPVAQQGCVDIARSSSGPGSLQFNAGPIVYVPFALDAVGGSTGPASCTATPNPCASYSYTYTNGTTNTVTATPVPTALTTAGSFTLTDLQTMYDSCGTVTEGGVTYNPGTATGTQVHIDLYIPNAGSGTRSFWATTIGFNSSTPPACVHDTIVGGPLATASPAVPVEQNNGTPVATDPNGYTPYSIAQWIAQRNGHADRRHAAVLDNLNAISPFSNGNANTGALNTGFPITRDVYDVVSFTRVTNTNDPLFSLLNGTNSFVCTEQSAIISYGFALVPSICGEVVATLRAQG